MKSNLKKEYKKKYMNWRKMAYHKCGYLIEDIPHNNIDFFTHFIHYCPKCGKQYELKDLDIFIGAIIWNGVWYNPFTWFKEKAIKKEL